MVAPKKLPPKRPEAKCPVCGKMQTVRNGRLAVHGPGKISFFCDGSGKPVAAEHVN
jgi:hypothetical protein